MVFVSVYSYFLCVSYSHAAHIIACSLGVIEYGARAYGMRIVKHAPLKVIWVNTPHQEIRGFALIHIDKHVSISILL